MAGAGAGVGPEPPTLQPEPERAESGSGLDEQKVGVESAGLGGPELLLL